MHNKNVFANDAVICTNELFCDPAIDLTEPEQPEDENAPRIPTVLEMLDTYRKTRDINDLRFKPGVKPVLFKVRQLKTTFTSVIGDMNFELQRIKTFCAACYEVTLADGTPMKPKAPSKPIVLGGHNMPQEDEWVDRVRKKFGISSIIEVAEVVFQEARLPEDSKAAFLCLAGLPRELSQTR